jgi:nucleotide-binding universal stress UspA family protein
MPDSREIPSFRRAVLGLNGGPTDTLVVRLACELARASKAELNAVHVIEVDWRHALTDVIPGSHERASTILDLAETAAERHKAVMTTTLLQARDVGAAIVDEAVAVEADLIILGLPYRKRLGGDFRFGRVVPYVLQNAPMAVWIVREAVPAQLEPGHDAVSRGH